MYQDLLVHHIHFNYFQALKFSRAHPFNGFFQNSGEATGIPLNGFFCWQVLTSTYTYTFWSFISEFGGWFGLFLGDICCLGLLKKIYSTVHNNKKIYKKQYCGTGFIFGIRLKIGSWTRKIPSSFFKTFQAKKCEKKNIF